jgi:hypothetical protein
MRITKFTDRRQAADQRIFFCIKNHFLSINSPKTSQNLYLHYNIFITVNWAKWPTWGRVGKGGGGCEMAIGKFCFVRVSDKVKFYCLTINHLFWYSKPMGRGGLASNEVGKFPRDPSSLGAPTIMSFF